MKLELMREDDDAQEPKSPISFLNPFSICLTRLNLITYDLIYL